MTLRADDFAFLRTFLAERSGLNVWPEKTYLIESRLTPLLRQHGIASLQTLIEKLRAGGDAALERSVIEAMMTHETLFFRDLKSFDLLRERVLPELIATRRNVRRLSIWSAACSAGQEPYSIAMMLDELADQLSGWSIRLLATDLSQAIISRAKAGVYNQFEVQRGLPVRLLLKHFAQDEHGWTIEKRIGDMVDFQTFNLLHDPAALGRFDLILCRNVLIYFEPTTRTKLFTRLRRQIAHDGTLMLGGAETVLGATLDFMPLRDMPNFFKPAATGAADMHSRLSPKTAVGSVLREPAFPQASAADRLQAWRSKPL